MRNRNKVISNVVTALRLLRTERPTLEQLADGMGCSVRTARRYMDALEAAPLPIRRHGPHYRLEGGL